MLFPCWSKVTVRHSKTVTLLLLILCTVTIADLTGVSPQREMIGDSLGDGLVYRMLLLLLWLLSMLLVSYTVLQPDRVLTAGFSYTR